MKRIQWKILIQTSLVCLLPILLGVALWEKLPDMVAIHFDMNNNPNNYASKGFAVFGLPLLMMAFQVFGCIVMDWKDQGTPEKYLRITKWFIPVLTAVLYVATLGFSLGWKMDIRLVAGVLVGTLLVVSGSILPKFEQVRHGTVAPHKARKINRFIGFETVVMGLLFYLSLLFPPTATVVCVFLLIPYTIISVIYGIYVARKKETS